MHARCLNTHVRRAAVLAAITLVGSGWSAAARADGGSLSNLTAVVKGAALHVTVDAGSAGTLANTQLMIDTDADASGAANTGYHAGAYANGFEIMVEGTTVYRFKGTDPAAWSWDKVGTATRKVDDKTLTVDVDLSALGDHGRSAAVIVRALSPDYQTLLAAAPPATAQTVALDAGTSDDAQDKTPAKAGAISATVTQDGTDLVIKIAAATPADLNTVLVFFDTDGNAATGFAPPADPRFGFEAMIQGGSLSKHGGATRDAWAWTPLGTVRQKTDGSNTELRFNASLLKATKLKVSAWQMSADWQTRTDAFPKSADGKADTVAVPIDASKLHAMLSPADVPIAPAHANAALPARERFAAAKSYACYYGADMLGPLSHVDAAILHVPAMTPENVKKLSGLGVVTIGYISVGEDETLRVGNGQGYDGKASWYFDKDKDGKPDANGVWGSYYANCADPLWRADRVAEAKRLCGPDYGFDGIFLDTIDTVDVYSASRPGMIQLIQELRAAIPDKVIVDNRGFGILDEPAVDKAIDGVMFEDFSTTYDFAGKKYLTLTPSDMDATRAVMTTVVQPAQKVHPFQVLALDYCEPTQSDRIQTAFDRAVTYGMLPAVASISLDMVYDTASVVGHPDKKYLNIQATPEVMRYTLDTPRNGFPAGTVVEPSSCFFGYTVATVVDGIADHSKLDWMKASWASAEAAGTPQQLLVKFPQPVTGGGLEITFAYDNKTWYPSRDITVDVSTDGQTWRTITRLVGQSEHTVRCPLPSEPMQQVRITQPAGGGSVDRPNLLWLQQVKRTS